MNKLDGFPSIYYLSLEESLERREHLIQQFSEYGITNLNAVISKRFEECDDVVIGELVHELPVPSKGVAASHLRCIKRWLNETDEPYGFFCEDDLSLKTVEYWNFTWKEFVDALPENWNAVQLMKIRDPIASEDFPLRKRWWDDWSATAYILKREYAREIIERYYPSDTFILDIKIEECSDWKFCPGIESLLFLPGLETVYIASLFVEECYKFATCLKDHPDYENMRIICANGISPETNYQVPSHLTSHDIVLDWWKNNSRQSFEQLMNVERDLINKKLNGFPSVYYITLEESIQRQNYIEEQFKKNNINPIAIKSKRYAESDDIIEGEHLHVIWPAARGVCASHLKAIKKWYSETDEEYAFFCEDDVSLEPVKYWNFTWKEFVDALPYDWECVQLMWIREHFDELKFRERSWDDWSATAYILTRGYAKKLIDTYHYDDAFHLTVKNLNVYPVVENILFLNLGKVYTVPLFVEEVKDLSTVAIEGEIIDGQAANHHESYDYVMSWWIKNQASLEKIMNISNKKNVVDCFSYFNEKEILELRINLLKNHVDKFIISESNYTHSGNYKGFNCKQVIRELELPEDIIEVIEVDLCDENLGPGTEYEQKWDPDPTKESRERLQRDAIARCLQTNDFDDQTVFIVSDADEIIDPKYIPMVTSLARSHKDRIFKCDLIHLEGRADYRVYYKDTDIPIEWRYSLFFCLKEQMERTSLTYIRSDTFNPYPIVWPYNQDTGERMQDLGWHFTWMGGNERRYIKSQNLSNFDGHLEHLLYKNYFKEKGKWKDFFMNYEFYENNIAPSGTVDQSIKPYSTDKLHEIIFDLPRVKEFLLPELNIMETKQEQDLLVAYAYDTENPQRNFDLARWYHEQGQTASAISYYLRAADRTDDLNLAYQCLIHMASCFNDQKNRDYTVRGLYQHAISILPKRPEAYYLYARFEEWKQQYAECYTNCTIALNFCDFNLPPLFTDVGYIGKYGIVFEKAVSSYWWGKSKECRNLFIDLKTNYNDVMDESHRNSVGDNLMRLGCWVEESVKYEKDKFDRFKFKFPGLESIERSHGQALQDMFVLSILNGKKNGTYLEIGSQEPFFQNNTALLETDYDWKGVSIEIREDLCKMFAEQRKNTILCKDATTIDYERLIEENYDTKEIDYLQVDCEPSRTTFEILLSIPFDKYKFSVITYEHDYFVDMTETYRTKSRNYLKMMGYELVVGNVSQNENTPFEDWWVHPDLVDQETIEKFKNIADVTDVRNYFYQ